MDVTSGRIGSSVLSFHIFCLEVVTYTVFLLQTTLGSLPVDHIPNSTEILRLTVLILQVVGVLPSINTQ